MKKLVCPMLKRSSRNVAIRCIQQDSPVDEAHDRTGALPWKEYIGSMQKDIPNMIKGLTPYQILRKLTSQTQTERFEICWKEGSQMTGQQLHQHIHTNFQRGELLYIRALPGHSGENLDFSTLSHKQIEKGQASSLHHIGFSRHENPIKSGGRVPGGFGISRGRKTVCSSRVSSLDPNLDPKCKPYHHLNKHHDRLCVFDLGAAQN